MCLTLHQVLGTQRRKRIQQCKMTFLNHCINKPYFINVIYKEAHNFEVYGFFFFSLQLPCDINSQTLQKKFIIEKLSLTKPPKITV